MMQRWPTLRLALAAAIVAAGVATGARAQDASPYAIDIPRWFTESFLDFREDIADAAKDGRRLLVYFGQDGCPYCRQLMVTNFSQQRIVDKTRRYFVAIAINIWGDREVTWLDGRKMSEKALARALDIQFTPTLLFFDEKGAIVARLNGTTRRTSSRRCWTTSPARSKSAKRWRHTPRAARPSRRGQRSPTSRSSPSRRTCWRAPPAASRFETTHCAACDEMHQDLFRRPEVQAQLDRFDVARFALGARTDLTAPDGTKVKADAWARDLRVDTTPTIVFFDASGREVFRVDAYQRAFHFASAFDYVASGAYRSEPSFQRYVQARADTMRAAGTAVDLWH